MPRRARCSIRNCNRLGAGDPPLCTIHVQQLYQTEVEQEPYNPAADPLVAAVNTLLNHPRAQEVVGKVSSGIDRLGQIFDRAAGRAAAAAAAGAIPGPPPPPRRPPPFPGFQPPRSSAPPPPRPRASFNARAVFGFPAEMRLTAELVKKRYRELAKKFHPDKPGGSTAKMSEVNRAHDILTKEVGGA